jgi:hypothetical protein
MKRARKIALPDSLLQTDVALSLSIRRPSKKVIAGCVKIADSELRQEVFGLFQQTCLELYAVARAAFRADVHHSKLSSMALA